MGEPTAAPARGGADESSVSSIYREAGESMRSPTRARLLASTLAAGPVFGLLMAPAANAADPVESGPWTSYSPSFTVQERGCGDVNNLTFTLTCSDSDGDQRAERRYATYSGGTRQFEGYFRIVSMGGSRISLKQTFKTTGAFFMLAVERGGRLYSVNGGTTISTGATVGTSVRVNTVHVVGSELRVYINGSRRYATSSSSGDFYDKFGAYRTSSGEGPITVEWSNVGFWRK